MKRGKLNEELNEFEKIIPGFTRLLEETLESRTPQSDKINLDNLTSMPTYSFAILALENNSPLQVIKVMEALKKRYNTKDKEVLGYLDAMEAKSYGYIALNSRNIEVKYKFYKLACKCFENAISRGYNDAVLDFADLKAKMLDEHSAERYLIKSINKSEEAFSKLGSLFNNFEYLVTNALRVLEKKRPIIQDDGLLWFSLDKFQQGIQRGSINSKLYYGLGLIVKGEEKKGMEIVRENFEEFKEYNQKLKYTLFASDRREFEKSLELLENKLKELNKISPR